MLRILRIVLIVAAIGLSLAGMTATLGTPTDVTFTAKLDNTAQRYVLMLPEPFDATAAHSLLIALHGHGSDRWQFATGGLAEGRSARDEAAKYNMIYVSPDYRASTSWMGPAAEADLLQIIDELKAKYKIDKVFLVGASMGGTATLTFTALHPALIAGACAENPHANLLEYTAFQEAMQASFGGDKVKAFDEYKKRSAEYWPEAFTMPLAITTGGRDATVPPQSAVRLANLLKQLGRKTLLIHREEGPHSTTYEDGTAALEFVIRTALGMEVAAPPAPMPAAGKLGFFFADQQPTLPSTAGAVDLGLKFEITAPGTLTAFAFYKSTGEKAATHTMRLWNAAGEKVLEVASANETTEGWQTVPLEKAFAVKAGESYTVSYTAESNYPATPQVFAAPIEKPGIRAITGVYSFTDRGTKAPAGTYQQMSYFVDVSYSGQ